MYAKIKKIYPAYVSKHNSSHEKQAILLMISNGGKQWHYLAVKKLSALLRAITSKHYGDFYCLNFFHSFRTKNKLESHKRVSENKDFCNIIMSSKDNQVLEFNQYQNSDKGPFITYANHESQRLMDAKIILKIHPQQKYANIFHQVFQYLQYLRLEA